MLAAQANLLALIANVVDIMDKCNAIVVEQASQREDLTIALTAILTEQASQRTDLTAALSAIWDKVKTL